MKLSVRLVVILMVLTILLTACNGATPAPTMETVATKPPSATAESVDFSKKYPIKTDVSGPCSYASISQKNYAGRTLNIVTHVIPVLGEPTELHAKQFEELTGAKVRVKHIPFGELYQTTLESFKSDKPSDVFFYASLWIGDFAPYLAPVPQNYLDMAQMKDVTANYIDVATWNGQVIQFPVDGDRHYLKYRADIIENPKFQEEYKKATGKVLAVPQTWKEYEEIARFFNNKDWSGDGNLNYGTAEVTSADNLMFSAFISRVAPYAKHPQVKGGFYFDLETMTPLVNTPGWVEGLKDFIAAQASMPPDGNKFTLADEIFSFGSGQTLFSYSWDDAFVQAMEKDSPIRNQVKAAPLPGAKQVWNRQTKQWDEFKEINRAPYIAWGWTSGVAKNSQNQDMAFDYLCFFANPSNHNSDLLVGRFGINPFRKSDFSSEFWNKEAAWDTAVAQSLVDTYTSMENSKNRVFDLRIPGVQKYMSSMAEGVSKAMAGEMEPQAALDKVAGEWQQISQSYGVENQRKAYQNIVKLEDNRD